MADRISPKARSANMRAIRSKGMKPELLVRNLAHRLGYRFRLHRQDLPGRPDLVFPSRRKIIFVHGCFWHQHKSKECKISRRPKSNLDYWIPKLEGNVKRDIEKKKKLEDLGWDVLIVWECITKNEKRLELYLKDFLG